MRSWTKTLKHCTSAATSVGRDSPVARLPAVLRRQREHVPLPVQDVDRSQPRSCLIAACKALSICMDTTHNAATTMLDAEHPSASSGFRHDAGAVRALRCDGGHKCAARGLDNASVSVAKSCIQIGVKRTSAMRITPLTATAANKSFSATSPSESTYRTAAVPVPASVPSFWYARTMPNVDDAMAGT